MVFVGSSQIMALCKLWETTNFFVLLFNCYYELLKGCVFNLANIPDNQNSIFLKSRELKLLLK